MKAETRIFGTIEIADDKIITLDKGMIGFPNLKHFSLIFDEESEKDKFTIMWLQSMDDGDIAFPVIMPTTVKPDYAPSVNDEILCPLGELTAENTYILTTVTVPSNIEKITSNFQAPIIINTDNNKGAQIIVEGDYEIRFPIYDLLQQLNSEKAGE